jgi:glycosyltransferase involved in cell wall biosynthesis
MKIAIVCGHFVPEMGYVEVHLANAFQQLGHTLKVITSNKTSFSAQHINLEENKEEAHLNYEVVRLTPWFSYGQIVVAKGINKEIAAFQPDKVIVVGLGKIFPKEVFQIKNRKFELITLLGDNEDTYNKLSKSLVGKIKRSVLQQLFKAPVYELAIKESDQLVGYTPSTKDIVSSFIDRELKVILDKKYTVSSLGFDEDEFYFSSENRAELRRELKIDNTEIVVVTATRINEAKKLEKIIDAIAEIVNKGISLKYVLIGFSENEYCKQLKAYISNKKLNDVVLTLPFIPRKQMVNYYNMADIGLWSQAAISIFEAQGTGLFLLLPDKQNVSHIISKETGIYYTEKELFNALEESVRQAKINLTNRTTIAEKSKKQFSFKTIANNLIKT